MKQRWIIAGIGMLLFGVTLGVFYLAKSSVEVKKMAEARADSTKVARERQKTPAMQQSWSFETYEQIQKKGLKVYLYPGWKSFPTGGVINIKTPDGTIIKNYPGVDVEENASPSELRSIQQKGWYTFYPNPIGSERGVIIFNCWTCQQGP